MMSTEIVIRHREIPVQGMRWMPINWHQNIVYDVSVLMMRIGNRMSVRGQHNHGHQIFHAAHHHQSCLLHVQVPLGPELYLGYEHSLVQDLVLDPQKRYIVILFFQLSDLKFGYKCAYCE